MITNIPNISVIYKNNPLFFTHVICNLRVSKATIWLKAYSLCPLILKTKLKKGLYLICAILMADCKSKRTGRLLPVSAKT